uniref:Uncharacterized protein n=1 Tax=Arundo donax TaxID=35708 RepID=A0A0A9B4R1_ARUDO
MRRLLEARADLDILYDEDGPEEALMIPLPVCSNVLCHRLARLAVGCCGRSYCCVQHLLESPHPRNHAVGLPTLLVRSDLSLDAVVPGCVRPACPPWWLRKAFCTSDQIVYEFLSSDDRVGGQMVHSYEAGQNEPVVEF